MGSEYTVTAGKGNNAYYYFGTKWLVIALW